MQIPREGVDAAQVVCGSGPASLFISVYTTAPTSAGPALQGGVSRP